MSRGTKCFQYQLVKNLDPKQNSARSKGMERVFHPVDKSVVCCMREMPDGL
jgi:hypothetical protein